MKKEKKEKEKKNRKQFEVSSIGDLVAFLDVCASSVVEWFQYWRKVFEDFFFREKI